MRGVFPTPGTTIRPVFIIPRRNICVVTKFGRRLTIKVADIARSYPRGCRASWPKDDSAMAFSGSETSPRAMRSLR